MTLRCTVHALLYAVAPLPRVHTCVHLTKAGTRFKYLQQSVMDIRYPLREPMQAFDPLARRVG